MGLRTAAGGGAGDARAHSHHVRRRRERARRAPGRAYGYTLKGSAPEEIVAAVRAVGRGEALFGAGIAAQMLSHFGRTAASSPFPQLTEREHEVLGLLAAGRDNAAVARRLGVSSKTVRNHVSNIITKLHVTDRSGAIIRARDAGMGGAADST